MVSSLIFKLLGIQVFDHKLLSNDYSTPQKSCAEGGRRWLLPRLLSERETPAEVREMAWDTSALIWRVSVKTAMRFRLNLRQLLNR
jgi:hypothetical protein